MRVAALLVIILVVGPLGWAAPANVSRHAPPPGALRAPQIPGLIKVPTPGQFLGVFSLFLMAMTSFSQMVELFGYEYQGLGFISNSTRTTPATNIPIDVLDEAGGIVVEQPENPTRDDVSPHQVPREDAAREKQKTVSVGELKTRRKRPIITKRLGTRPRTSNRLEEPPAEEVFSQIVTYDPSEDFERTGRHRLIKTLKPERHGS